MMDKAHLESVKRGLVDEGKLVEAGWVSLRIAAIPEGAPAVQLEAMRNAFFAGAHFMFASIMEIMEEGDEVTEADMRRMSLIQHELETFIEDFAQRHGLPTDPKGTA